jgi:putative peptidoglycan lipid II flippase
MRLVLLQTLVSSASGIAMSVLQAHQHFLLPAAAPLAYTLGRVGGALFLAPHLGIFGLAVGGLLGTLGHFLIQVPGLIHVRARWWPALTHPDLPQLLALMGPRMLGLGATYLNFVLPTFLGSRLAGGAISAYEYGWRLMQFPETLIGTALGLTVYPTLAAHANAGDHDGLRRTAGWTLRLVLALAIPAGAAMVVLGRPFTALLLQRGAFDAQATARVAQALRWLAPGLVGHAALEVVSRAFYARRDMWTPLGAAVAGLLTNAVVGWLLLPVLAQGAIALANSTGVCLQVALLLAATHRRDGGVGLHHQEVTALARSLARTLAGTALMTLALLGVRGVLAPERTLLIGVAGALVGGTVYLAAAWLLQHEVLLEARHRLWGGPP